LAGANLVVRFQQLGRVLRAGGGEFEDFTDVGRGVDGLPALAIGGATGRHRAATGGSLSVSHGAIAGLAGQLGLERGILGQDGSDALGALSHGDGLVVEAGDGRSVVADAGAGRILDPFLGLEFTHDAVVGVVFRLLLDLLEILRRVLLAQAFIPSLPASPIAMEAEVFLRQAHVRHESAGLVGLALLWDAGDDLAGHVHHADALKDLTALGVILGKGVRFLLGPLNQRAVLVRIDLGVAITEAAEVPGLGLKLLTQVCDLG
jgi:hypothetical protein